VSDRQNQPFQLCFNASLKIDFQGSRVNSDAGLILVQVLNEPLGFSEFFEQHLTESRGRTHSCRLRTCCGCQRSAVWQDTRTSTTPRGSPKIRPSGRTVSGRIWERGAALMSRPQSFETEVLA
jgi:hypothetical protein